MRQVAQEKRHHPVQARLLPWPQPSHVSVDVLGQDHREQRRIEKRVDHRQAGGVQLVETTDALEGTKEDLHLPPHPVDRRDLLGREVLRGEIRHQPDVDLLEVAVPGVLLDDDPDDPKLPGAAASQPEASIEIYDAPVGQIPGQLLADVRLTEPAANGGDHRDRGFLEPGQEEALAIGDGLEQPMVAVAPVEQEQQPVQPAVKLQRLAVVGAGIGHIDPLDLLEEQTQGGRQLEASVGVAGRGQHLDGGGRQRDLAAVYGEHVEDTGPAEHLGEGFPAFERAGAERAQEEPAHQLGHLDGEAIIEAALLGHEAGDAIKETPGRGDTALFVSKGAAHQGESEVLGVDLAEAGDRAAIAGPGEDRVAVEDGLEQFDQRGSHGRGLFEEGLSLERQRLPRRGPIFNALQLHQISLTDCACSLPSLRTSLPSLRTSLPSSSLPTSLPLSASGMTIPQPRNVQESETRVSAPPRYPAQAPAAGRSVASTCLPQTLEPHVTLRNLHNNP